MTGYVSTRYYWAPEIMFPWKIMMSPSIFEAWDVFSPRCLRASPSFPERIVRRAAKALFHASESFVNVDVDQFSIITELFGT